MAIMKKLSFKDIEEAQGRVSQFIQPTQCLLSRSATEALGCEIYLKHENEQRTGSFKIRGAMNRISCMSQEQLAKGIIACSAGNHAQGVAFSATAVGSKAHIVMPEQTPLVKVMATQGYGAEVILHGKSFDEAYSKARELEQERGYEFVHPFNDTLVMAGQGTIGLEIVADLKELDSIIIPIGGGGLISGVATAIKHLLPNVRVYGVVPENVPGMFNLYKGLPNKVKKGFTIADGLAVKQPNIQILDDYIRPLVDDICTVNEDELAAAIVFLLERAKTVV